MEHPVTLVIATRNKGKTAEISQLLANHPVIIKNLDDFGPIPEVEEDGKTFEENAYKKAAFAARILGYPALADDSGLVVEALDGAPGIHSARYAGTNATDTDRCNKLLAAMAPHGNRNAAFECVISIAVPTGAALTYEARCEGRIGRTLKGSGGFGYDPVFYDMTLNKTFAQMPPQEKNRVSHRGRAFKELKGEFDKVLIWITQNMPRLEKFTCSE